MPTSSASPSTAARVSDERLPRGFFDRDVHELSRALLGCHITHDGVTVRLTEVEAYRGVGDPGSHVYRGRTPATATLFARPGTLYVYFSYGMHFCANLVAGQAFPGSAVLLRAGEVIEGVDLARARRTKQGSMPPTDRDLARGPARLAASLALTRADDGSDTTRGDCAVRVSAPGGGRPVGGIETPIDTQIESRIEAGPRVGVSGPGGDGEVYPWRYWLAGDPTVSTYRRSTGRWRYAPRNGVAGSPAGEAG